MKEKYTKRNMLSKLVYGVALMAAANIHGIRPRPRSIQTQDLTTEQMQQLIAQLTAEQMQQLIAQLTAEQRQQLIAQLTAEQRQQLIQRLTGERIQESIQAAVQELIEEEERGLREQLTEEQIQRLILVKVQQRIQEQEQELGIVQILELTSEQMQLRIQELRPIQIQLLTLELVSGAEFLTQTIIQLRTQLTETEVLPSTLALERRIQLLERLTVTFTPQITEAVRQAIAEMRQRSR